MKMAKEEFQGNLESFTLFAKKYLKHSKDGKLTSKEINMAYIRFCELREFLPMQRKGTACDIRTIEA